MISFSAVLNETNFLGVATKALSATHKSILPDQPMGISTHTTSPRTRAIVLRMRVPDVGVPHDRDASKSQCEPNKNNKNAHKFDLFFVFWFCFVSYFGVTP